MLDMLEAKFFYLISKYILPDDTQIKQLKERIPEFKYPIGIILAHRNVKENTTKNSEDIFNYFTTLIDLLLSDYYNKEEQKIINYYIMSFYGVLKFDDIIFQECLKNHSNKIEIQYCIDELKFTYLSYLIYNEKNDDKIEQLIQELSLIEDEHNQIIIVGRKTNV